MKVHLSMLNRPSSNVICVGYVECVFFSEQSYIHTRVLNSFSCAVERVALTPTSVIVLLFVKIYLHQLRHVRDLSSYIFDGEFEKPAVKNASCTSMFSVWTIWACPTKLPKSSQSRG